MKKVVMLTALILCFVAFTNRDAIAQRIIAVFSDQHVEALIQDNCYAENGQVHCDISWITYELNAEIRRQINDLIELYSYDEPF